MLAMPPEIDAEDGTPGIGQPGRHSQHLFFAATVAVNQHSPGSYSQRSEEIRWNLMSVLGHEIVQLNQLDRHHHDPVPQRGVYRLRLQVSCSIHRGPYVPIQHNTPFRFLAHHSLAEGEKTSQYSCHCERETASPTRGEGS